MYPIKLTPGVAVLLLLWPLGLVACIGVAPCDAADPPPALPPLPVPAGEDPGPIPDSITVETVRSGLWRCTFHFQPKREVAAVSLAGTFNNWQPNALPMNGPEAGNVWTVTLELPAGVHLYKFVVEGSRWVADRQNPDGVHDGHSGRYSVLRLGRIAHLRESPAEVGDGRIEALALEHDPDNALYFQKLTKDRALFRLRTLSHDVEHVWVAPPDGANRVALTAGEDGEPFMLWEVTAELAAVASPAGKYVFILADGDRTGRSPGEYEVPVSSKVEFHTPDWAKHAIWYQIMMDRFRNGAPDNDRQPVRPWTSNWFTPSPWEGQDGQTFYEKYVFDRQYGGDLDGLEEKLPYLKDLGVNALYLNPVFKAESHHKYNAETYLHIDDHFGTKGDYDKIKDREDHTDLSTWVWTESDQRFLRFLKKAHQMGFRVIIDGVFNHVGVAHPAFQDVKRNGPKSKYADWFDVTSWDPFEHTGWAGHAELPVFKKSADGLASETVKQHIFNVTRRWMDPDGDGDPSDGIDGWRLDVPNEIPAPFWVEWRELVKSINPEAYITGEIWQRAEEWLDGEHFDAVMNYEFARAAVAWIFDQKHKITASEIDRRLRELRRAYPWEATLVLQNLMGSHDTDRVASMAHNPDRAYDHANRVQDNGPSYDNGKPTMEEYAKARLAAFLQMTYVGAPMIYYGDEVGMWGGDDPTCRKPMLWADLMPYENPDDVIFDRLFDFYKEALALRNAHPALRTGSFRTLLTDDENDVWVFLREDENEYLLCALNGAGTLRSVSCPLPPGVPDKWTGAFVVRGEHNAKDRKLQLIVGPWHGIVWQAPKSK